MFFYERQTCPVCGRFFGEQDDIVTCPECGAPHHRACWKKEGHCHFKELHGTKQRWSDMPESAPATPLKNCPRCGYRNPEFSEFCAHCGLELKPSEWSATPPVTERPPVNHYTPPNAYQPFTPINQTDPYGGVPHDAIIEEVPVKLIADIVGPNAAYYLPRFMKMANGGSKISWNWAAFLLDSTWLLYRKNAVTGLLSLLLLSALSLFNQFFIMPPLLAACGVRTLQELLLKPEIILQDRNAMLWYGLFAAVTVLTTVIRLAIALFGNYFYMRTVLKKARKQMQQPMLMAETSNPFSGGGVSFVAAILPQFALSMLVNLITLLLTTV